MSYERQKWPVKRLAYYLKGCLTPKEFGKRCGISKRTVYRWLDEGRLGYVRIGNKMFVPLDQVIEVDYVPATRPVNCRLLQLPSRTPGTTGAAGNSRAARTKG